jgi:tetratricopeptide repeat protein 30
MNAKNESAEKILKSLEDEEEELCARDPKKHVYHLCIVNLVIGTLYCAKVGHKRDNHDR